MCMKICELAERINTTPPRNDTGQSPLISTGIDNSRPDFAETTRGVIPFVSIATRKATIETWKYVTWGVLFLCFSQNCQQHTQQSWLQKKISHAPVCRPWFIASWSQIKNQNPWWKPLLVIMNHTNSPHTCVWKLSPIVRLSRRRCIGHGSASSPT